MPLGTPGRRVAIIAGVRTPFAKAGTVLKDLSAIDLGKRCVAELIQRAQLDGTLVDGVVYGTVVPSVLAPILPSRSRSEKLVALSRAKTMGARLGILGSIRPRDLVPITPAIAEPSTGE